MSFGQACFRRPDPSIDDNEQATSDEAQSPVIAASGAGRPEASAPRALAATSAFSDGLDRLAGEIDRRIAADAIVTGRFARAYVDLILSERHGGGSGIARAQSFTMMRDPQLYVLWSDWLMQCLTRHVEVSHRSQLDMIHHAAVGLWLGVFMADAAEATDEAELRRRMLRLLPW